MRQPASIFNDVIGPVMIGPSSSHTAASVRIGRLIRQMVNSKPKKVIFEFEPKGSLATTYHGQGSDIGLVGGLLNYETFDTRIVNSLKEAKDLGIEVEFNVVNYEANHPNTYRTTIVESDGNEIHVTFLSTGGGMIELTELEGFKLSITGGFFETIIFLKSSDRQKAIKLYKCILENINKFDSSTLHENSNEFLINIKTQNALSDDELCFIEKNNEVNKIINLSPVLPIKSQENYEGLLNTAVEIEKIASEQHLDLWEIAVNYESSRGNISKEEAYNKMKEIVKILKDSIEKGKKGTSYEDRILGHQSNLLQNDNNKFIPGNVFNSVIKHITLMMEIKSSMGVIVAAPTAGSCGALPGTIIGVAAELGLHDDEITKAMLAAGIIGVLIAEHSTFAAEVCGCQAECGSGSGMTAAGLVQLMGGSAKECIDAASMALQNIFGLVCDPVADRVEVPCLGKNIMAGTNAMAAANMSLAGFDKVIPLDETIESFHKVGTMLPSELRCTGYGGLSITKTSKLIHENLQKNS